MVGRSPPLRSGSGCQPSASAASADATASSQSGIPNAGALKQFAGHFLIYRKMPHGFTRAGQRNGAGGMPRFRHETIEAAITEAQRLHALHPDSTFVIMQEVASIRHDPAPGE